MSYASTILADTPQVYLRLGDSSGTTAVDSSGNSHDGTYVNSPTLGQSGAIVGDPNTAVLFNGSSQYVSVPVTANYGTMSWECWVYLTSTPAGYVTAVGFANGFNAIVSDQSIVVDSAGNVYFYIFDGGAKQIVSPSALSLNAWHHLVGTVNGTTMALYVDGVSVASQGAGTAYTGYSVNNVWVAAPQQSGLPASYFPGTLDEVALYNYALSSGQVAAHYTAGTVAGSVASGMMAFFYN